VKKNLRAYSAFYLTTFAFGFPNYSAKAAVGMTEAEAKIPPRETASEIVVTARRRSESLQKVPFAISAISGEQLERSGINNIEQLSRTQPSIQLISTNPRNTATTIRGQGSTIGLTNDGLEPGVGIYIDDVYFARPGSAVVDLVDIERIEILRGPQGTLFGKNTTAGALNITTRGPSFNPEARIELSGGDYGFLQTKLSVSGPLISNKLAGRISFGATRRQGNLKNVTTNTLQNDLNSQAVRAQLLFTPSDVLNLRLSYDFAFQDPEANTQGFVRYGPTLRTPNRQFPALAAQAGYAPPSLNVYDRLVDVNSPIQAKQVINGASATVNWEFESTTLTSISAWRKWEWTPQNDRDYTALSIRTLSANNSKQDQFSQEVRLASKDQQTINWVVGLYYFDQEVQTNGREGWGKDAARWLINSTVPSNLIDGYLQLSDVQSNTKSYAIFGQLTWNATERLRLTQGLRLTNEEKGVRYDQKVSGGLNTTDSVLIAAKLGIARNQFYEASVSDNSLSGQFSLAYDLSLGILSYVTVSRGYKSGGVNAAGIPTKADGTPSLISAVIKPEEVTNIEGGLKSQFFNKRATVNLAIFSTDINDYQANVVDSGPGALRGYLANIDKVEVRGLEVDTRLRLSDNLSISGNVSYTDAKYASFKNAPAPLELQSSSTSVTDLSGKALPGVSKWAGSIAAEYVHQANIGTLKGDAYISGDVSYRSKWNSDSSVSKYAEIDASILVNLRLGFRAFGGVEGFIFIKNAFDKQYLQFTTIQAGNSGAIYGQPGDPRSIGFTLRQSF
jgi:iron complex outermembrane recepter protein